MKHFVDSKFGCAAESVLYGAHYAVHVVLASLKLKHRVDHVLQNLRTGYAALFVDVTDEYDGCVRLFGELQNHSGALADLANASRRTFHVFRCDGLYGVNDNEFGLDGFYVLEYSLEHRFAHDLAVG